MQQNGFDAGMAQERSNELAVPVEADGLPNRALNVVGHERAEQLVDLGVRQLGEETTDPARDFQSRAELRPPPSFIDSEIRTAQSAVSRLNNLSVTRSTDSNRRHAADLSLARWLCF